MTQHDRSTPSLTPAVAPSLLREMNQRLLLDKLFTDGPSTRPQLAKDAGLSQPTVFAALDDLERVGLVRQTGRPIKPQGRPAAVYEANPTAGHVVGVDIGRSWLHLAVADLAGTVLAELDAKNPARSADALVDLVATLVHDVTAVAELKLGAITHIVIGSPGVLDQRRGGVLYARNLPGWHRSGLAAALTERLGGSITIDNDANLAALAEHTHGAAQGVDDVAYVHIGTGLGVGLILEGHVYRGHTGAAGEVGYLPIGEQPPRTGRPHRGMLEEEMAADAIVRRAKAAGMTGRITAETVFRSARTGDPAALAAVDEEAKRLAQLVASISAFVDPELIVIGGGVGSNLDLMLPKVREALALLTPLPAALVPSQLGPEAVVRGAIARGVTIAREVAFRDSVERVS